MKGFPHTRPSWIGLVFHILASFPNHQTIYSQARVNEKSHPILMLVIPGCHFSQRSYCDKVSKAVFSHRKCTYPLRWKLTSLIKERFVTCPAILKIWWISDHMERHWEKGARRNHKSVTVKIDSRSLSQWQVTVGHSVSDKWQWVTQSVTGDSRSLSQWQMTVGHSVNDKWQSIT